MEKLFILLTIIISFACSGIKNEFTNENTRAKNSHTMKLLDGEWLIKSIGDKELKQQNNAVMIIKEDRLSATIGCNIHRGILQKNQEKISIQRLIATEKYCLELVDEEQQLVAHLKKTAQY